MAEIDTANVRLNAGKHRGELLTRVPLSYVKWMANERGHSMQPLAAAELRRRGSTIPTIELSAHAIDRASLRVRKIWHETRGEDEGLHSWLCRMVTEAIAAGPAVDGAYFHQGMKLVVEQGAEFPVLKPIMPKRAPADG